MLIIQSGRRAKRGVNAAARSAAPARSAQPTASPQFYSAQERARTKSYVLHRYPVYVLQKQSCFRVHAPLADDTPFSRFIVRHMVSS